MGSFLEVSSERPPGLSRTLPPINRGLFFWGKPQPSEPNLKNQWATVGSSADSSPGHETAPLSGLGFSLLFFVDRLHAEADTALLVYFKDLDADVVALSKLVGHVFDALIGNL